MTCIQTKIVKTSLAVMVAAVVTLAWDTLGHAENKMPDPVFKLAKDTQIVMPSQLVPSNFSGTIANAKPYVGRWMVVIFPGATNGYPEGNNEIYKDVYLYDPQGAPEGNGQVQYLNITSSTVADNPFVSAEIGKDAKYEYDIEGAQDSGDVQLAIQDSSKYTNADMGLDVHKGDLIMSHDTSGNLIDCSFRDEIQNILVCKYYVSVYQGHKVKGEYGLVRVSQIPAVRHMELEPSSKTKLVRECIPSKAASSQTHMSSKQLYAALSQGASTGNKPPGFFVGRWRVTMYPAAGGDDFIYDPNGIHNDTCQPAYLDFKIIHTDNPFATGDALVVQANFISDLSAKITAIEAGYGQLQFSIGAWKFISLHSDGFLGIGEKNKTVRPWFFEPVDLKESGLKVDIMEEKFGCVSVNNSPDALLCVAGVNKFFGFTREK